MMTTTTGPPGSILMSAADLAAMLGISVRHVWRLRDAGELPKPIKLGSLVRWHKAAIDRWLAEGNEQRR